MTFLDTKSERGALDAHMKKTQAISALREIQRLVDEEKEEKRGTTRFSGVVSGAIVGILFGTVLLTNVWRRVQPGSRWPVDASDVVGVFLFSLLTVMGFAAAYYFRSTYPRPVWRVLGIGLCVTVALAGILLVVIAVA